MIHKERKALADMKHLLVKFRGDASWIPGERIVSEDDAALFEIPELHNGSVVPKMSQQTNGNRSSHSVLAKQGDHNAADNAINGDKDVELLQQNHRLVPQLRRGHEDNYLIPQPSRFADSDSIPLKTDSDASFQFDQLGTGVQGLKDIQAGYAGRDSDDHPGNNAEGLHSTDASAAITDISLVGEASESTKADIKEVAAPPTESGNGDGTIAVDITASSGAGAVPDDDQMEDVQVPAHRMTTRAQAQAVSDQTRFSHTRSPTPDASNPPYIHPLFIVPQSALPDRDFSLPPNEAEETRRILMMWVQKQEEVVRGVERLYEGLLKADRMRKTVYKWCKAEGHVGEMSDGEDWYDKEEWGLDEDLKKGQLEEEDDTVVQGKKTRGRRTAQ